MPSSLDIQHVLDAETHMNMEHVVISSKYEVLLDEDGNGLQIAPIMPLYVRSHRWW